MVLSYLIILVTAVLSGSAVFLIRNTGGQWLKLMLAFSGAFLIGITFMVLVPEVYHHELPYVGLFVLLGFILQLLLELLTQGAEHGHEHQHTDQERISPFLLLAGLCIHAFIEGLPLTNAASKELQHSLVLGIVVHNIPISLTLTGLFLHCGCSRMKALAFLVLFALMTPIGAVLGQWIQAGVMDELGNLFPYTMAVVIGIFLHVSTSIIFETGQNHRYNLWKFLIVLAGLAGAFLVSLMAHVPHVH